nr:MAG TPA: hypothetical protein [Caudoviricetes sp.]
MQTAKALSQKKSLFRCPFVARLLSGWQTITRVNCYLPRVIDLTTTGADFHILATRLIVFSWLV